MKITKYALFEVIILISILLWAVILFTNNELEEKIMFLEDVEYKLNTENAEVQLNQLLKNSEIIEITNAEHVGENKLVIKNIYDQARELDEIWSPVIREGEYVRVTFEKNLTSINDITIYPRIIIGEPIVEIYEIDSKELIAQFTNIKNEEYNKVFLTNLNDRTQDTFDLKILNGEMQFDHIIDPTSFRTVWNTSLTSTGSSGSNQITLPLVNHASSNYNFIVDWGDGTSSHVTSWSSINKTKTYASAGVYEISITGTITGWQFNNVGDRLKLLEIKNWGPLRLGNAQYYFYGASNMIITATDILNLSGTTNLEGLFYGCTSLTTVPNMDLWDVSQVTNINSLARGATNFNQNINAWNTSNIINMLSAFREATNFNQPLDNWDTSKVTSTYMTFGYASSFNQNINTWNMSQSTGMDFMFREASSFNQPLNNWNTSNVEHMELMFRGAVSFNQPLDNWDTSSVTNFEYMFDGASSFNQNINAWNTSQATRMDYMFREASSFNQPLDNWDTSNVINMYSMFRDASSFDQNISSWIIRNVADMTYMFDGAKLSINNYDSLLIGWASQSPNIENSLTFYAGNSQYLNGENARNILTGTHSWTIIDGGFYDPLNPKFISVWDTTGTGTGASASNQVRLPLVNHASSNYNFHVDWGDGTTSHITSWDQAEVTHTYPGEGIYQIKINGTITGWRFNDGGDKRKIIEIMSWGPLKLGNTGQYFYGASGLRITATDILDLSGTTSLYGLFYGCRSLTTVPNMGLWNVSQVTTMRDLVREATYFNENLNDWNVSSVVTLRGAFRDASSFNQPLDKWDTSKVTTMESAFEGATSFNQNLGSWNVGNVTTFLSTFLGVTLSTNNYDSLLIGWANQTPNLKNSVSFHGGNSKYSINAITARNTTLMGTHSWSITDGGLASVAVSEVTILPEYANSINNLYGYCNASGDDALGYRYRWYENNSLISQGTLIRQGSTTSGDRFSCGLLVNGSAVCWGEGTYGKLGNGREDNVSNPELVSGGYTFSQISSSTEHTCGVLVNGSAMCWGSGGRAQLGNNGVSDSNVPVFVYGGYQFIMVDSGHRHSCGVLVNGSAMCWGYQANGRLGNGVTSDHSAVPVFVSGNYNFTTISAGSEHTCGVLVNGSAMCWGAGDYGTLGRGSETDSSTPVFVGNFSNFVQIKAATDAFYSCGILANGSATCWGAGTSGRLGLGHSDTTLYPELVLNYHDFIDIDLHLYHTCGLLKNGSISCWGYNNGGQLGFGGTTSTSIPELVNSSINFVGVSVASYNTCGTTNDGKTLCWGSRTAGALGDGLDAPPTTEPQYTVPEYQYSTSYKNSIISNMRTPSSNQKVLISTLTPRTPNAQIILSCQAYDVNSQSAWTNSSTINIIDNEMNMKIGLDVLYPKGNMLVEKNKFFKIDVNVTCDFVADCGEIDVTFDPQDPHDAIKNSYIYTSNQDVTGSSVSFSYNHPEEANFLLVVPAFPDTTMDILNITYGGYNLNYVAQEKHSTSGTSPNIGLFKLINAPSGNNTLVVTFSGSSAQKGVMVYSLAGINDIRDYAFVQTTSSTIVTSQVSVNSEENDLVLDFIRWRNSAANINSIGTDQVLQVTDDAPTRQQSSSKNGTSSTTTMSATLSSSSSNRIVHLAVSFEKKTKGGVIPVGSGNPFYTNESNPRRITLSAHESQVVTAWVNATGETKIPYVFFVYANKTSMPAISNITNIWTVQIVDDLFSSTWDTTKTSTGSSNNNQITLPLVNHESSNYNFLVDWGDGAVSEVKSWDSANKTHTYATAGVYEIKISGTITGWRFNNGGDKLKLLEIKDWGTLKLGNAGQYFYGASNMIITAQDLLNTTGMTTMSDAFYGCSSITTIPRIAEWDMSSVTVMLNMFRGASLFNQDLNGWDTSNLTRTDWMFGGANLFNGNISNWNTSKVSLMNHMFYNANDFNQDISSWNTRNVTRMDYMFFNAGDFNQPIGIWDMGEVTNLRSMFQGAAAFNQPLNNWSVHNVETLLATFSGATSFNQSLNNWTISQVTRTDSMFEGASSFNQPLNNWNTSKITNMDSMFQNAVNFDQNISSWNVGNVTTMVNMFLGVTLSSQNYDALLIGWANQTPNLQNNVSFHGGNSKYSFNALSARNDTLIGTHSWSITDGGMVARITLEVLVPTETNVNITKDEDFNVQIRTRCLYDDCGNIELSLASTFLAIPGALLSSNPITFSLNKDQDNIATFNLNGVGVLNTTYLFSANAKIVNTPTINATTNTWDVTIVASLKKRSNAIFFGGGI